MSSSAANFAQSAILRRLCRTFCFWIGVTVNLWRGSVLTWQENFMISYQSECFFDGLLTLMSSLLNYHRRNVGLESARCPSPKGRFLTTYAASKGEKKPAHSDNNDAPAVKLPT
ncbi:BnaC04g19990D [Brassica napus]|nr:unnamed protein product [Brassica napus]CDY34684.1 BnaC04g19990D [Brassica napus]